VAERAAYFEDLFHQASSYTVHIDLTSGGALYPQADSDGWPYLLALVLTITILTIGVVLAPHLLVEEKERHTIDVLLVSPASYNQVIAGKALAGLFYCLTAAVVVLAFDARYIVHWEAVILAMLLGAACAVLIGLLFGVLSDAPSTVNMWAGIGLGTLIVPVFLQVFVNNQWPAFIRAVLPYVPSVAMSRIVQMSMAQSVQMPALLANVAVLAAWSVVIFALVVRQLRRIGR
jgi:ABC-2 type transport system permease protein